MAEAGKDRHAFDGFVERRTSPQPTLLVQPVRCDHCEAESGYGQRQPAHPKCWQPNNDHDCRADEARQQQKLNNAPTCLSRVSGGEIGADSHQCEVAETHLSGPANNHRKRHADERVD